MFAEYVPQTSMGKFALAVIIIFALFLLFQIPAVSNLFAFVKEKLTPMPNNSNMLFGVIPRANILAQNRQKKLDMYGGGFNNLTICNNFFYH